MNKGDICLYTDKFDADLSDGTPNIAAAIVTKVNADGTLDLACLSENGLFFKASVSKGDPGVRGTWHPK